MVNITPKSRSLSNGTANDATPVEQNFVDLYNNDATLATALTSLQGSALTPAGMPGMIQSAAPVQLNNISFSMAFIQCSNNQLDGMLVKTTPTTVDISTHGLNGSAISSHLSGTITITAGATTVNGTGTSFTTDFQVGDLITTDDGQSRRISAINSATSLTLESGWGSGKTNAAYSRGGYAPNTWYYLYAISNGSTVGVLMSSRNAALADTLIDLPTGYNRYRQHAFALRTDASGNILPFMVTDGWPRRTTIIYVAHELTNPYLLVSGATATDFAPVNLNALVPPVSKAAWVHTVTANVSGSGTAYLRPTGTSLLTGVDLGDNNLPNLVINHPNVLITTNAGQQIDYKVTGGASFGLAVRGYTVTEIS